METVSDYWGYHVYQGYNDIGTIWTNRAINDTKAIRAIMTIRTIVAIRAIMAIKVIRTFRAIMTNIYYFYTI